MTNRSTIVVAAAVVCAAVVTLAAPAMAQEEFTAFSYNVSVPLNDTSDYIGKTSWRGAGLDIRRYLNYNGPWVVGFSLAWHVFNEKTDELLTFERDRVGTDAKGLQRRYINSFPIMLNAFYYTGEPGTTRAYLGVGAGTYFIIQRFEIGVNAFEEGNWHFGFAPEVGFHVPLQSVELFGNVRYNYAFESGETVQGTKVPYTYIGFNIGLAYARF